MSFTQVTSYTVQIIESFGHVYKKTAYYIYGQDNPSGCVQINTDLVRGSVVEDPKMSTTCWTQ